MCIRDRYIADLVQKQRSLVRQFESSNPLGDGASERTFLMAKQLAFKEAQRNSRAIHLYKRLTLARAQVVNCASDHLFAGSRLALDEDCRVRRRNDSNALEHSFQPLTITNDFFEIVLEPDFVFQVKLLLCEPLLGLRYLPKFQGVFYRDGDLVQMCIRDSCNPSALRLLGYDDPSELLGKNMHCLLYTSRCV